MCTSLLDLYGRVWEGDELGYEYVLSADESSELQALSRSRPRPTRGRPRRAEFEHHPPGNVAYFVVGGPPAE
jgi:hypothetical protein